MSRTETQIQRAIQGVLKGMNWRVRKIHGGALNKGYPDLYVGCPVYGDAWIEVKVPGKKLRDSQISWMLEWEGVVPIIVCDDEEQVLDLLEEWHLDNIRRDVAPRDQWYPWATRAQRKRLDGANPLADALREFEG